MATSAGANSPQNVITGTTTIVASNVPEFVPERDSWFLWKERLDIHFCEIIM